MYEQKLFYVEELRDSFNAIEPELIRFPSLSSDVLKRKIEQFIESCSNTQEGDK